MNKTLPMFLTLMSVGTAAATIDFTKYSDLAFAEKYAFSTNRAELIATLKKDTGPWYFYSLLNLQTEGQYDAAKEFVRTASRSKNDAQGAWDDLHLRQMFLDWENARQKPREGGRTPDEFLVYDLGAIGGIRAKSYTREVPVKPNTYPSMLDPAKISFKAFCDEFLHHTYDAFEDRFRFLAYTDAVKRPDFFDRWKPCTPETPGFYEAVRDWLKKANIDHVDFKEEAFKCLTLSQLEALRRELPEKGDGKGIGDNVSFIELVLGKLAAGPEEDVVNDLSAARRVYDRELKFLRTLPESQYARAVSKIQEIIELERKRGNFAEKGLFLEFVKASHAFANGRAIRCGDLEKDYLAAFRRAGSDLKEFADFFSGEILARLRAESDLLAGVEPAKTEVSALSDRDYKELVSRVELNWSVANAVHFAANDAVSLAIDVKNVPKMRLAIYELDAFAATVKLGAEVKSDLDLDGCVPTVERTLDYTKTRSIVRHRETLDLSELKKPGLYVVECSGAGLSSRALVRKGALRISERIGAGGHVFTALDEDGVPVKDARLKIGATTLSADEKGEIAVPFAVSKEVGETKIVIGTEAFAVVHTFDRRAETYGLTIGQSLPREAIVAGRTATAILKASLTVAGKSAPLSLIEKPVLRLKLTDRDGVETVRTIDGVTLADDAEIAVPFVVPARLDSVEFTLSGSVRSMSEEKDVPLAASTSGWYNGLALSDRIAQAFLREGSDGYSLELRGRNGEPLAAREVKLDFKHLVFKQHHAETLQTDAEGHIRLGKLTDITTLALKAPFELCWHLKASETTSVPDELTAVEGETIEFPVRGLFAGDWPMADTLSARVSLVAVNAMTESIVESRLDAVSYADGVLKISGLAAGDYALVLRGMNKFVSIKVTRTSAKEIAGGFIVGPVRGLADTGAPGRLRIAAAALDAGVLKVRLANAGEGARVALSARRFSPDADEGLSLFDLLAGQNRRDQMTVKDYARTRTDYVSGRDLGDKLRYILDRRNLPHRPSVMLDRPSLILNPWSEKETVTKEETVRPGENWAPAAERAMGGFGSRYLSSNGGRVALAGAASCGGAGPVFDFLAEPARVWVNLRPDKAGVVTFKVPVGAEYQDFEVVAVDREGADRVTLQAPTAAFARRDSRHFSAKPDRGAAPRTKTYSTVAELYELIASDAEKLREFAFVGDWANLPEAEKRELYGKYASHELDLFLSFKDRTFFDAVVLPHLRNKRLCTFTDKWLLGEDLADYAKPGALQDLNALEKCLLAKRVPALAKTIADALAAEVAASPVPPEKEERLLAKALGFSEVAVDEESAEDVADFSCELKEAPSVARAAMIADVEAGWSNQAKAMPRKMSKAKRDRADLARRENRQLYRPPARTREWMETYHYKMRHDVDTRNLVRVSPFWRDYAASIAADKDDAFGPTSVMFVEGGLTEVLAALAVANTPITFTERRPDPNRRGAQDLGIVQRFFDPEADTLDEQSHVHHNYALGEFVAGRRYSVMTVLSNPTDREVAARLFVEIPDGAIALGEMPAARTFAFNVKDCSMTRTVSSFYFPEVPEGACGVLHPASVSVNGELRGEGRAMELPVVAVSSKEDQTTWRWISQNGSADEVLAFLRTANLAAPTVDLDLVGWRMKDRAFAEKVYEVLSAHGVYHEGLWRTSLEGRYGITENAARIRELLMHRDNRMNLARKLGPEFHTSIIDIDPEETDLYEHKEYWPLINARVHALGGTATIANESLKKQYRAFLDVLATHRVLTAKDRLDAAVYLLAQDRFDEAERILSGVKADDAKTKMQFDYLQAYLAFANLKPDEARKIAARYADYPVARWRDRFRKVIEQAEEIRGEVKTEYGKWKTREGSEDAPSIELVRGEGDAIAIKSRNVQKALIKAFPTDVEVTFSKDPFGGDTVKSASSFLKPVWTTELKNLSKPFNLPSALRGKNLIIEAADAEGRATASLTVLSGALDVQTVKEYGELRVRDDAGRPLAAAYVKVYARDATGTQVKFYKDGYTDLRGAFDYAGVSTDSEFRPEEFAILVFHDTAGVKVLKAPHP